MAVAQDLVLSDPESDIITHESTSALQSSEHDGDDEVASIIRPSSPHSSPRPSLLASRLSSIVFSSRTRRRNKALGKERVMMNRLHRQLVALRSMVPPSARSSQHSVIADALKYKKALKNEIHQLQRALPFARQVNVVRGEGGLQISLVCKKKSGLLIALMEAIESFGLVLSKVNVCCRDGIMIDALSTQGSTPHVDSLLKFALMTTIARFSPITSV